MKPGPGLIVGREVGLLTIYFCDLVVDAAGLDCFGFVKGGAKDVSIPLLPDCHAEFPEV